MISTAYDSSAAIKTTAMAATRPEKKITGAVSNTET